MGSSVYLRRNESSFSFSSHWPGLVRRRALPLKLCAMATAVISLSAATLGPTAAAQSTASDAAEWQVPRTPHGHPDLQGNWTNATLTPVQRPQGLRAVLSPEQVAEVEDRGGPGECWSCSTTPSEAGERVTVVNGEPRSSLITHPADGRAPELTLEGHRRVEERTAFRSQFGPNDHPELLLLADRCLVSFGSNAGPPMLPNYFYLSNYTIVQNADHVMIMTEMVHDVRIIRLGEPIPLPNHIRPWFGDSWGRWEGDTLVVETTNLNPDNALHSDNAADVEDRGVPPSEDAKVIERFTLVDEETIHYEFTIDDPTMYASTWGGEVLFERFDDLLYEYSCHEGNYSLSNSLSGARYEERNEEHR